MLSPRYLAGISDDIVRIYAQLEHDIVIDMARRLHKMGAVSDASVWQAGVFNEIGGLQADVQKYLAKYDKQAQKEITALFEEALRKSDKADMRVFDAAKRNMSDRQRLIFDAIAEKQQSAGIVTGSKAAQEGIIKTFSNLSRLTMSIAATSSADFITQANAAFMQTVTGAFDYKTALKNAVKNLAQKGIHTVEYTDSGKRILRSIEGAVRSNILTGINQTASRRTLDNCQKLDCDLVEVSAHMGARPSHAAWQGKVYSLSGTSDKYPSFYQECRPGEPDGIGGVNCRHSYYPYFEGMPRMYSDGELDEMKEPTVEYNGKKITQYEAEQNLRALERGIRKHKLEVDALEAAELDATAEKQRLGAWQAKAREYCKETGIRRDYSREYVGTASGKQPKGLKPVNYSTPPTSTPKTLPKETLDTKPTTILPKKATDLEGLIDSPKTKARKALEENKVLSREVFMLDKPFSCDKIIARVGGGDKTKGSCSSVALAYAANRAGFDVLDYRDGASRLIFGSRSTIREIAGLNGVKSEIVNHYNDFTAAHLLMAKMETAKEYYFATGSHGAIIRKLENGVFEYLELQDDGIKYTNGFKLLTDNVLKKRFACKKTHTKSGTKLEPSNFLIDIESLGKSREFVELMKYINTSETGQIKGTGGHSK